MTRHFDFIVFENYHQASHHKIDMVLIAKMLQHEGKSVAILNIYNEDNTEDIDGILVINLPWKKRIPNDIYQKNPKNKIHSLLCYCRFLWQQHWYMKDVVKFIEPMAHQFYCGSYHLGMSSQLFKMKKPCYYWGLRSSRMTGFWNKFRRDPIKAIRMLMLREAFKKNPAQKLFVSNQIIKNEFVALGIPQNRMAIREERCIEYINDTNADRLDKNISFLVIGQLRIEKHVELTINAFKKANIKNSFLKLIGKSRGNYEEQIQNAANGYDNIVRKNVFLSYSDFIDNFKQSHFVLFADEEGESCITNGTMLEALINYRPIICPNYNPYRYYIEKYKIGILYTPSDVDSYAEAIKTAEKLGIEYFIPAINNFLETITFERVAKSLNNAIDNIYHSDIEHGIIQKNSSSFYEKQSHRIYKRRYTR